MLRVPVTAQDDAGGPAWNCPCGAAHDRDVDAAINMLAAGRADIHSYE
jgi:transposase